MRLRPMLSKKGPQAKAAQVCLCWLLRCSPERKAGRWLMHRPCSQRLQSLRDMRPFQIYENCWSSWKRPGDVHRASSSRTLTLTLPTLWWHRLGQIWIWLVQDFLWKPVTDNTKSKTGTSPAAGALSYQVAPKVIEHEAGGRAPASFWKLVASQGSIAERWPARAGTISFKQDAVRCCKPVFMMFFRILAIWSMLVWFGQKAKQPPVTALGGARRFCGSWFRPKSRRQFVCSMPLRAAPPRDRPSWRRLLRR